MANMFDVRLLRAAKKNLSKLAFVDPATAAGGGGMPPMDPSMMGMGGGMPPMGPSMMGMAAPPPSQGGLTEDQVRQIVQEAVGGGGGSGGGGKKKMDIVAELHQIKKLLVYLLQATGVQLPPEILLDEPLSPGGVSSASSQQPTASQPSAEPPQIAVEQGAIQPIQPIQPAATVLRPR